MSKMTGAKKLYKVHKVWVAAGVAAAFLGAGALGTTTVHAAEAAPATVAQADATYQADFIDMASGTVIKTVTLTDQPGTLFEKYAAQVMAAMPAGYELDATRQFDYEPSFIAGTVRKAHIYIAQLNPAAKVHVNFIDEDSGVVFKEFDMTDVAGAEVADHEAEIEAAFVDGYRLATDKGDYTPVFKGDDSGQVHLYFHKLQDADITVRYLDRATGKVLNTLTLTDREGRTLDAHLATIQAGVPAGYVLTNGGSYSPTFIAGQTGTADFVVGASIVDTPNQSTIASDGARGGDITDTPNQSTIASDGARGGDIADTPNKSTEASDAARAAAQNGEPGLPVTGGQPGAKATTTKTTTKTTATDPTKATGKQLPQTGDRQNAAFAGLGVLTVIGALFGLTGERRKRA